MEFSLKDASSKPFAWMLEGVDVSDLKDTDLTEYVKAVASTGINATNYGDQTDDEIMTEWLETGELEQAVAYIEEQTHAEILSCLMELKWMVKDTYGETEQERIEQYLFYVERNDGKAEREAVAAKIAKAREYDKEYKFVMKSREDRGYVRRVPKKALYWEEFNAGYIAGAETRRIAYITKR